MFEKILNLQTKTISTTAIILAAANFFSHILGLMRDYLLAKRLGAGMELDAYFAAFIIPDFIFNLLLAGGALVVFLPMFSDLFAKREEEAWYFTNNILNIILILLITVCAIIFIFAPFFVKLIAPGFFGEQLNLTILLTRLLLVCPVFFALSSILSGILNYFNKFLSYSLCPIMYNLAIIFGIVFLAPVFGIFGVAIGVILGAFSHFLIQLPPAIKSGFKYGFIFDLKSPDVKKFFKLMFPRIFSVSILQIEVIVFVAIASTLSIGSVAIFNFANNLQFLPIMLIGVPIIVAVFPALSKSWTENQKEIFIKKFSLAFRQIIFLAGPFSVLMFILREQIVAVIFRHGQFSITDAKLTSDCLGLFCIGILAYSLALLMTRTFYSFQDSKTPALMTGGTVALGIILAFCFVRFLKNNGLEEVAILGLPLAFSIGTIFYLKLSMFFLYKKIGDFKLKEIAASFFKVLASSVFMAVGVYFILYLISPIFDIKTFSGAFWQLAIAGTLGVLIYIASSFIFRSPEIFIYKEKIFNIFKK